MTASGPGSGRWAVDDPDGDGLRRVVLVLVRHAESQWNAMGLAQGHNGPGLTDRGHYQAARTALALQAAFPDAELIVRSDLVRVADTAQPFEQSTGLPVQIDLRWREIDNGSWAGKPYDQVVAEYPHEIDAIRRGEDAVRGGGESFSHLRRRVGEAVPDVRTAGLEYSTRPEGGTVIVFTHGGTIRAALAEVFALPPSGHRLFEPPVNCSFTVINQIVDPAGGLVSSTLEAYNRCGHLKFSSDDATAHRDAPHATTGSS